MPQQFQSSSPTNRGWALFSLLSGTCLLFGAIPRYLAGGPHANAHIVSIVFGILLVVYGLYGVFFKRVSKDQMLTESKTTSDRLMELDGLKTKGLITEQEYAAKRQEILKDL
jgi:uncharacterized membrane protein